MACIAGILNPKSDEKRIKSMLAEMKHRGPDSEQLKKSGVCNAGVGALDLSKEHGNGFAHDGETFVLFDGEIYNDRQDGESNAQIVLRLFKAHGPLFPAYLKGAFACAVCTDQEVLLARDLAGIRPLYFGKTKDGEICFASEMKGLADEAQEVYELRPQTSWSSKRGISGYLPRHPELNVPTLFDEAKTAVRDTVFAAVEKRLADKAAQGCFLSGGLDSSIIAAAMHEINPDLPVYTVGVEGAEDVENAKIMADFLGIRHHTHIYDVDEIKKRIPKAVRMLESFDEDCVMGAAANLIASDFAGKESPCLLSGEGGDELFGGYHLLKELPTEDARLAMMNKLISISYNTALQRLDRAMMGNSVSYRTPFLDSEVIALALQLPVRWKIHLDQASGKMIEKYILREAFQDMLPPEIYKREKLRFSRGTGTENFNAKLQKELIDESAFTEASRQTPAGYRLNTPLEMAFYKIFKKNFPADSFEKMVGRWDPNK